MATLNKAIVVGTGAGGLSAAAYLAKQGMEVIALDQADRIGGFLAPFSVEGYTFDTGLHYVGQARQGQLLNSMLRGLDIHADSLFLELDPDGFDVYRFPDLEVRMCAGVERYRDRVSDCFPTEREGLRRIFDMVSHFHEVVFSLFARERPLTLQQLSSAAVHLPSVMRWRGATFEDFLTHFLRDPRARAVLAAACGNAGLPPSRLAAWVGIGMLAHYGDGAFYPRGGSGALRDALVESATRLGARFRTNADVVEIVVRQGKVSGVRLAGGERIEADVVVSDADPTLTFGKLLTPEAVPSSLRRKLAALRPSLGSFAIYLGMKRDLRSLGFGAFNVVDFPSWDLERLYEPCFAGEVPSQWSTFLSSGTSRDDSGRQAPTGCSTLEIITSVPWEPFAAWATLRPEQRGAEYRQLRQRITEQLLGWVETRWPGLVGDVAVQRVSTPLTNTDYTRAVRGGMYGPENTPEQLGRKRFQPATAVPGLFLTGAGVFGGGIVNCLLAGQMAAGLAVRSQTMPSRSSGLRRGFERLLHVR